jgi:hypothetical protein
MEAFSHRWSNQSCDLFACDEPPPADYILMTTLSQT